MHHCAGLWIIHALLCMLPCFSISGFSSYPQVTHKLSTGSPQAFALLSKGQPQVSLKTTSSLKPSFLDIEIMDVYNDVTWYAPRLKNGQFLCVPIDNDDKPRCVYFVKEISKNCEIVDFSMAF